MVAPLKVIITDLGKVLVDFDFEPQKESRGFSDFLGCCRVSPQIAVPFFSGKEFCDYEKGKLSSERFFEIVRLRLGYVGDYARFQEDFCATPSFALKRDVYDFFFREIKPSNDTEFCLLSNLNELHYRHLISRWPGVFSNCRELFLSFKMGLRKPDPKIYARVLEGIGAARHDCFFVDDSEENCEAAKNFFDHIHRFQGIDGLRSYFLKNFKIGK